MNIHRMFSPAVALLSVLSLAPQTVIADLAPPAGYLQPVIVKKAKPVECEEMPKPFTGTLDFPSKYEGSDSSRSTLNPESDKRYKKLTAPVVAMEKGVVSLVGKYMASGNQDQLDCALTWLSTWAKANALEGDAPNHTGRSIRKWTLGSLSSAYLRLKFSSSVPLKLEPERAKLIEAWLGRVADRVMKEWSPEDPIKKINNHYYWVGWSLMATAVATDRQDLFDRAVVFYRIFESQIDADGYLPNELNRATRALGYHSYALAPLTVIAAFAEANKVDLASEGNGALSRLATRVARGIRDPQVFAQKTGAEQDIDASSEKTQWVWLEPYCSILACNSDLSTQLNLSRPNKSTRLGGDLTAIYQGSHPP
ncbi:mannuronate-specific alginate lyase [Nevskia ramosa]|uniref:mannuronate-specific alginate lyase n=1 Tax=Nevskia ramosa TaxID=64002 RepID=UPI003D0FEB40